MTVWGACGRWFESSHPDWKSLENQTIFKAFAFLYISLKLYLQRSKIRYDRLTTYIWDTAER